MSQYKVVGKARFQGHAPGSTFEAKFSEDDERRYIERGSIAKTSGEAGQPPVAPGGTGSSQAGANQSSDAGAKSGSGDGARKE